MVTRLTDPVLVPSSQRFLTRITTLANTAAAATRNITQGSAELVAVEMDNLTFSATKNYVKLYDDATSAWAPGTSKPVIVVPVETYAAAVDDVSKATGFGVLYAINGFEFEQGISIAAAQEDGDAATTAPGGTADANEGLDVDILHRPVSSISSFTSSPPAALLDGLRTMQINGAVSSLRALIGGSDATSHNDINSGSATVYRVRINAVNNPVEDVYVRFFDNAAPTVGTTDAELLLCCRKGTDTTWEMPRGISFGTALSVATVKDAGATAGNSSPTGTVDVIIDLA